MTHYSQVGVIPKTFNYGDCGITQSEWTGLLCWTCADQPKVRASHSGYFGPGRPGHAEMAGTNPDFKKPTVQKCGF